MKLRRVQIENFRGIRSLDLELGDTTVLIGENNTGKTAVLDALRFALEKVRSRRGSSFDAYDFHLPNATSEPATAAAISIRLTFREDVAGDWGDQQLANLNRAKIAQIDANNCASVILKVGARFDEVTQEFVQDWEFQNIVNAPLSVADSAMGMLQNEVSYYYLAALRDAAKHFDSKGAFWRPFLKESQLTPQKRTEIETKLAEVNQLIISSHASFLQVVARLKEVKDVVSMTGGEDLVSIDAVPGRLFDMLAKAQVSLSTGTGAKIPVGRHGEGTQSLAVLTLFNAFLHAWNRGDPFVAIEEPEAHLHPSAVRALWQLIERIPGQKIISTHSGDLLSEVPADSITRLSRSEGRVIATRLKDAALTNDEQRKINFHIRLARGELLFARCWILGEGESEVSLLSEAARILDLDLERSGVRCVAYQQAAGIEPYLKLANTLHIGWVVIADNDIQGVNDHRKVRNYLNGRIESDAFFVMPEVCIEEHLCAEGFGPVFAAYLTPQTQGRVTLNPDAPGYWPEVLKAIEKSRSYSKPAAIQTILMQMAAGAAIPQLFRRVLQQSLQLANSQ